MNTNTEKRGDKYYFIQYTTHEGLIVVHVTDVKTTWISDQERYPDRSKFTFWEADRFGMTLNCR